MLSECTENDHWSLSWFLQEWCIALARRTRGTQFTFHSNCLMVLRPESQIGLGLTRTTLDFLSCLGEENLIDSSQHSKCLIIGLFLLFSTQVKITHDLLSREKHILGSLSCLQCSAIQQAAPSHCIMITFLPTVDGAII